MSSPRVFFKAVDERSLNNVRAMLEMSQVDVNVTDKDGYTAIYHTIFPRPNPALAKILITHKADLNYCPNNKFTPVRALIDRGHYLYHDNAMSEGSKTYNDFFEMAELLKNNGARATKNDLVEIENTVSSILTEVRTDYIYDKDSFDRKLVDLFANPTLHTFKRVELANADVELFRAREKAKRAMESQRLFARLFTSPNVVPPMDDEQLRLRNQFLSDADARVEEANKILDEKIRQASKGPTQKF